MGETTHSLSDKRYRSISDSVYKIVTLALCSMSFVFIIILLIVLFHASLASIVVNGLRFFTTTTWNPAINSKVISVDGFSAMWGANYGMLVFFVGTLGSSILALLVGVPVGVGIALFISEFAPKRLDGPITLLLQLMAGIPSVIFGFWGILILSPWIRKFFAPALGKYLFFIPIFSGQVYSSGFLSSGFILALMIIPIIASISRDAMAQTPVLLKEGGRALGLTDWKISRKIVIPYARQGIIGGSILGLGRALGETMAVALVCGGADFLPKTMFYPINTLSAFIVTSLDSAFTDPSGMYVAALGELALVLLAITMIVNISARLLVSKGFLSNPENVVQV